VWPFGVRGPLPPIDEGVGPLTPLVGSRADAAVQHEASEVPAKGASAQELRPAPGLGPAPGAGS